MIMLEVLENDDGIRPAGPPDECFYCRQKVGQEHKPDCVCMRKTVRLRMTVEYEVSVPCSWSFEEIENHRHYTSWCANNALSELEDTFDRSSETCMCGSAKFKVLEVTDAGPYRDERVTSESSRFTTADEVY